MQAKSLETLPKIPSLSALTIATPHRKRVKNVSHENKFLFFSLSCFCQKNLEETATRAKVGKLLCMKVETREKRRHTHTHTHRQEITSRCRVTLKKSQLSIHIVADLMLQLIKI